MKFLLHLALTTIIFTFSSQFQVVKIGAIFYHDELDLMEAFDMAINDINHLELDVSLQALKHFLSVEDSIVMQEIACELIENGVSAIFGPSSKASSDIVEVLCNITGIPHLQFDWHVQDNVLHRLNHQMTVNLAPSETVISAAYWDVLRKKKWKSFTIVYESEKSLARMQSLFDWKLLHKTGIKVFKYTRDDDFRVLWKLISNTKEKFVVLDCPADILTEVVNASIFFNMTGPFNNFFLTDLDTHTSNMDMLYSKDFASPITAVRLRPYMPPPVHDEADIFEDEEEDKLISLRSQLLYDAVVLHFTAIRTIIRDLRYYEPKMRCGRNFWKPGPEILEQMKIITWRNVTPPFKTQKVQINEFGERVDFNLEIYNPMTESISYIWNKHQQLVEFEKIGEAKRAKKRKPGLKEDFSQTKKIYKVATRVGEPYFKWREEPDGVHYEGNERFEGYAVDLIYKLAEECKFDFAFEPVSDNNYGSHDPVSDEWNGIIRQLIDNNAQIGICDLTITQARRSVVDFTVPFMQLGVSILYFKPPPPPKNLFGFLKPYSLDVWVYLLIVMLITASLLIVTARMSQPDWERVSLKPTEKLEDVEEENKWFFFNTMWLYIGSILNQGCDLLPRGPSTRFFTAFWWIFALLVSQTYIAKLASFITASKLEGAILNLHDLVDQNKVQFGTVKGGSTALLFSESNDSDYRLAWNKMTGFKPEAFTASNKEGVDRVLRSRGRYAFLMETTGLQYYLQRDCSLAQIGSPFGEKHYGIAVPLNAPYRSNLSVGILKLSEKGELYKLKNKWFKDETHDCGSQAGTQEDDTQFTMESLGGLFVVLVVGVFISILIGIFEFFWNVEKICVEEKIAFSVAFKAEFKFFICFWLDRKPLHTFIQSRDSTSTGYSTLTRATSSFGSVKKKKKSKKKSTLKCIS